MRRAIDTAPKDGKFVILEDDAGGFELARWSAETRGWVRENGELSKITPTYWHRTRRDDYLLQEGDEFILQKEAGSSGPSTSPTYLHPTRRHDFLLQEGDEFNLQKEGRSSDHSASRESRSLLFPSGQAAPQRPVAADADIALRHVAKVDAVTVARLEARAAQGKSERGPSARRSFAVSSIAAVMVAASLTGLYFHAELASYMTRYIGEQDNARTGTAGVEAAKQETQVPSQDSQKADSLVRDPALHQQADRASSQAPRDTAQVKPGAEAMRPEAQQPLEKERRRAEALANELARAQQVIATQVDQATQLSQSAESGMAELRQSLQKEHDRAEALAGELAKARRDIETQLALPSKARDQAGQLKQAEKVTASLRQSLKTEHDRAEALANELTTARTTIYAYEAQARKSSDQAADLKQAAESAALELQKPLQQERERAARLEQDLTAARRDVETQLALSSKRAEELAQLKQATESATAELRQFLQKEHDRAEALSSELAKAQQDAERQLALSSKAGDEAAQGKKAAESTTAEVRQSLQQEHDRAEALASELATARTTIYAYEAQARKTSDQTADLKQAAESAALELQKPLQQERERAARLEQDLAAARRDVEMQLALSSKRAEEVAQLKQAAESVKADLRLSLLQERDWAPIREPTQPTIGARNGVERTSNSQVAQVTQTAEAAAKEQPAVAEAQGSPEAARLLARASALLGQGNIGAARIVLERAVETGSAQASFMLAETYDPLVLSTWKTYGTHGDVTKARELYAKALAGGIQEAKDRSVALR